MNQLIFQYEPFLRFGFYAGMLMGISVSGIPASPQQSSALSSDGFGAQTLLGHAGYAPRASFD